MGVVRFSPVFTSTCFDVADFVKVTSGMFLPCLRSFYREKLVANLNLRASSLDMRQLAFAPSHCTDNHRFITRLLVTCCTQPGYPLILCQLYRARSAPCLSLFLLEATIHPSSFCHQSLRPAYVSISPTHSLSSAMDFSESLDPSL